MAGETKSTALEIIVDNIRKKSIRKALQQGVMKNLVTVYSDTGGNKVSLPLWDATSGGAAIDKAEAVDYTEFAEYKNTKWEITPGKKVFGTKLTDETDWFSAAGENIQDEHAAKHAREHAIALETALCGQFTNLTTEVTAASGLTVALLMDTVTELEGTAYDVTGPYSLVMNSYQYKYLAKDMAQQGISSNYGPVGPLADEVLKKYHVANVLGLANVFRTTTAAIPKGTTTTPGTTDVKYAGLFTKEALGLFIPVAYEFETDRDASAGVTELISRSVFGTAVRFAENGVKIKAKAV